MKFIPVFIGAFATAALALPGPGPVCWPAGHTCGDLHGPVGICCPGNYCDQKFPDYFVCVPKATTTTTPAPTPYPTCVPQGELCSGFGGPVGTCCNGYTCQQNSPDDWTCQ